jgi:hypothetical protein
LSKQIYARQNELFLLIHINIIKFILAKTGESKFVLAMASACYIPWFIMLINFNVEESRTLKTARMTRDSQIETYIQVLFEVNKSFIKKF